MVRHVPFEHLVAHRQTHENLRGNAFHSQGRVVLEAKTPIERRITDQDAALRSQATNLLQSFIDECLTNPLSLKSLEKRRPVQVQATRNPFRQS